ncbi:MAG: hypothetical protein AAB368_14890, partial [bacterium]
AAVLCCRPLVRSSYLQWAQAYEDARGFRPAAAYLLKAARVLPDDAQTRLSVLLGKVRQETGDLDGAQRLFEEDQRRFPCFPEGFGFLSVVYGMRAQRGEAGAIAVAVELNRKALALRPAGKEAAGDWNTQGNLRVLAADEAGALESYRAALRCDPAFKESLGIFVQLLMKKRRRAEAEAAVRAALAGRPRDPELLDLARRLRIAP